MNKNDTDQFSVFDDLVASLSVDEELALKFFLVFSWFEYVLKELGYFRDRGYVQIDWIRFGEEFNNGFNPNKSEELRYAVGYLHNPVLRNQQVIDGQIEWDDFNPRGQTDLARILSRVTTVRNNFFHGGKFPNFRIRDAKLLKSRLVILSECVELHPDIKAARDYQLRQE